MIVEGTEHTKNVGVDDAASIPKSSEVPVKVVDGKVMKTTTFLET